MSEEKKEKKVSVVKIIIALVIIAAIVYGVKVSGLGELVSDADKMQELIRGFGIWGPIVFILIYIACCVFLLPGSMMTIVAGLVFGSVQGALLALTGATIGATVAFLIARYGARKMIEGWAETNSVFQKIDKGVEENGSSFLILTRLVPVFPFNIQNYAYGLTKIKLSTYVFWSGICMAPGAFIYAYLAGEIYANGFSVKLLVQFAVAGLILFGISLIPKQIAKKKGINLNDED